MFLTKSLWDIVLGKRNKCVSWEWWYFPLKRAFAAVVTQLSLYLRAFQCSKTEQNKLRSHGNSDQDEKIFAFLALSSAMVAQILGMTGKKVLKNFVIPRFSVT